MPPTNVKFFPSVKRESDTTKNIFFIIVTLLVLKFDRSKLVSARQDLNIFSIVVTFDVSNLSRPTISVSDFRSANKSVLSLGALFSPVKMIFLILSLLIALSSFRFHGELVASPSCPGPIRKVPEAALNVHGAFPQVRVASFGDAVLPLGVCFCLTDEGGSHLPVHH